METSSRPTPEPTPLLSLDRVSKRFGRITVAREVSIDVRAGEAFGVVGPNGAGKTSLFGLISGDLAPDSGEVRIDGRRVNKLGPAARCRLGIGRTYQVPRPFAGLSVFENVLVAAQQGGGMSGGRANERALEIVGQAGLLDVANRRAGDLGLLDRKRLELARALGSRPRLLLLDEVAGGLTDPEMESLGCIVEDALAAGIAVLWIEHVVRALLPVVSRLLCLAAGEVIRAGPPTEVLDDPLVRSLYLGDLGDLGHLGTGDGASGRGGAGDRDPPRRSGRRAGIVTGVDGAAGTVSGADGAAGIVSSVDGAAGTVSGDGGPTTPPALEVRALTVHYGQLCALRELSLAVGAGEVLAIIGANGAGKSTLLRTIAGLNKPTAGTVLLDGRDVTGERAERRVAAGIALVPEGRRLFGSLSVEENLAVGGQCSRPGAWDRARVYDLFPWMRERRRQKAAQLSGGEQQAVAIGRALVANPRVLLLDEVSLGLAPVVVQSIYALLPDLIATGVTVLLVEQDVAQALRVANRVQCVLEGRTTLVGLPRDLEPEEIEAAYFGLRQPDSTGATGDDAGSGGLPPWPAAAAAATEARQ